MTVIHPINSEENHFGLYNGAGSRRS
ncbi:hypothetical protein EDF61_1217, partial [Arthrobacter sp. JUb115]